MILNVSSRTDIVHYYTPWFLERLREGRAIVPNPEVPDHAMELDLSPESVQGIVFCSKDYRPLLPHLARLAGKWPVYCHYTITPYGRDVEPGVPDVRESMVTLRELSRIIGRERVAWRYDPVLLTRDYTIERHFETFDYLCGKLAGHVDRCIFSFVEIYRKLQFNMPELIVMSIDDMDRIAAGLGRIAATHGILLQTCGTDIDWSRYGIRPSGCMTLKMLGSANGIAFKPRKHKGQRSGCHCIESRDIGAYDSCPNSCRYCYANKSPERALKNYREAHDPNSPLLLGHLREGDIVTQGAQRPVRRA